MLFSRLRGLGDDYQSLPSSELLNQPNPLIAPDPTGSSSFIPGTGTEPVNRPLTEDEIAEQYGGNPITNVYHAPFTLPKNVLLGGVALLALGAVIYSGRGR